MCQNAIDSIRHGFRRGIGYRDGIIEYFYCKLVALFCKDEFRIHRCRDGFT